MAIADFLRITTKGGPETINLAFLYLKSGVTIKLAYALPEVLAPHQRHSGNAQNWKTGGARFKPRSRLSV